MVTLKPGSFEAAMQATADSFNKLGLAEHEGMEAFVQYRGYEAGSASPYFSGISHDDL